MRDARSMPAFRSVVSVLVRAGRLFSTPFKAGLRAAACGVRPRPPTPTYASAWAVPGSPSDWPGLALAGLVRPFGRGWPAATSAATSDSLRPEDLAARRRWVKASWSSRRSRSISAPLARSINPRIHGDLELLGQGALELGLGRGSEQAGHHPGIGLQSADLGVVPLPWVHGVQIQGPDRATAQRDWDTQARANLDLDKGQGDLAPALLQGRVLHHRRPAAGVRLQAGAGGEDLLVVLQGLGALVRGAGPAQLAIQVGQHDPS